MKNILVKILIIVVVAGVLYWLWRSGIISGAIAGLAAMLVGLFGGHEVQRKNVKEHASEVDRLVKEMQEADRNLKKLREKHDEEVKRVEEKYRDLSTDELIASANERERRRTDTSD
jgi:uncharacterized membrane protein YhiD involved in acid resistance